MRTSGEKRLQFVQFIRWPHSVCAASMAMALQNSPPTPATGRQLETASRRTACALHFPHDGCWSPATTRAVAKTRMVMERYGRVVVSRKLPTRQARSEVWRRAQDKGGGSIFTCKSRFAWRSVRARKITWFRVLRLAVGVGAGVSTTCTCT